MMQGNQNKLDKNQNGKIDPQDFKMLRGEKEERDMDRPTVKDRLKRDIAPKKPPVKQVGEMGKPSLKAEFEADMQKERDFVLKRAKIREEARDAAEKMGRGNMVERISSFVKDVKESKPKLLKSMSKEPLKKLKKY